MADLPLRPAADARAARNPRRGTYHVQTWGCQMNEEDSEQLALALQGIGFAPARGPHEAQVVLLNTCSVRKKPEDKAFSFLGELALMKRARPEMVIGVCGCMAQIRADEIRRRAPHVDFVLGTGDVGLVAGLVEEALQTRAFRKRLDLPERRGAVVDQVPQRAVDARSPKLKAFVPIQYGCDKFCTFCIVPSTRGRERSRPAEDIVAEVERLVALGTREVTLLGQTVNSYGKNLPGGRVPYSELLRRLDAIPGLWRVRATSPYPRDFRTDVVEALRDLPAAMEHCHMPLQSGDDDVLRAMKRLYTVDGFRRIVAELRAAMPGIGLTTDVIVGFPGETEAQFDATVAAMEEFQFDGAFMFGYSPRPGTPAADRDQLPRDVIDRRLNALIAVQNRITLARHGARVGEVFEVLCEGPSPRNPGRLQGYSREFHMMHFDGPAELRGRLVAVRATSAHPWGLGGELAG